MLLVVAVDTRVMVEVMVVKVVVRGQTQLGDFGTGGTGGRQLGQPGNQTKQVDPNPGTRVEMVVPLVEEV